MCSNAGTEQWEKLAELASQEQDPEKLMELVAEINRLPDNKENASKDLVANGNPEIIKILEEKRALLNDGSTKPDFA
jgi:hypothetical protein